jgi:hypothetical protein
LGIARTSAPARMLLVRTGTVRISIKTYEQTEAERGKYRGNVIQVPHNLGRMSARKQ